MSLVNTGWKHDPVVIAGELPDGTVGVAYDATISATGGLYANLNWPMSYTGCGRYPKWTVLFIWPGWAGGGVLPAGLSQEYWQGAPGTWYIEPFSPVYCRVFGTPTAAGTYLLAAAASGGYGGIWHTRLFTVYIAPAPPGGCPGIALSGSPLPDALVPYAPYSRSIAASGGTPPYGYGLVGGILPDGLSIGSPSGLLSGTPTAVPRSTVLVAPVPALTGTSMTVDPGTRDSYPATPFNIMVWPGGDPSPDNAEIVRVTAWSGDVLTIVREQKGTTAKSFNVGDGVALMEFPFTVRAIDAVGCMGEQLYTLQYTVTGSAPALEGPVTTPNELFVRTSGHVGNQGIRLGTELAPEADIVVSMAAGQYVLGSVVPQFGPLTHASAAIRSLAPYTKVVVYVGDGLANRDIGPIHGDGVRSSLVLGIPHNGDARYVRTSLDIGATSTKLNGVGSSTTAITALGENSISVGAALNVVGVTYTLLSFSNGLALTGLRSGVIGITWVEFALELA